MFSVAKFSCVVAAFVVAVSAVVWTAVGDERGAAQTAFAELETADAMHTAVLARESALRGFGYTRRTSFLEPYDEATAAFAAAADKARGSARGDADELAAIDEQQRLADRWAGSANDSIIRWRNRRPVSEQAIIVRTDLVARFTTANDELGRLIGEENDSAHRAALERAGS